MRCPDGVVAQLVEHHNGIVGVRGSNPLGSTILRSEPWLGFRAKDGVLRSVRAKEDLLNQAWVQSYGWQARTKMFYAYILQSVKSVDQLYRGHSSDLKQRLIDHNAGHCPHTAKFAPWKLKFYAAFETLEQAQRFEHYLKSGSGHAFAIRHLL